MAGLLIGGKGGLAVGGEMLREAKALVCSRRGGVPVEPGDTGVSARSSACFAMACSCRLWSW